MNSHKKKLKKGLPVRSPSITRQTSAKWRRPVEAILVATGRMSPMCVHSRAMYFFNREPTPRSSGSAQTERSDSCKVTANRKHAVSVGALHAVGAEVQLADQQPLEAQQQVERRRALLADALRLQIVGNPPSDVLQPRDGLGGNVPAKTGGLLIRYYYYYYYYRRKCARISWTDNFQPSSLT